MSSIPTTSITPATNANPNTVENVGHFLSQLSAASASLHPYITRLSSLLQQESTLQLPAARDETQQLASQLFPLMQQLGSLLLLFSNTLASLRMGTTAGEQQHSVLYLDTQAVVELILQVRCTVML